VRGKAITFGAIGPPQRYAPPLPQAGEVKGFHFSRLREKVDRA
jgi:hypothetical protein